MKNSQKHAGYPPSAPPPLRLRHTRTQMFYKQTAYFPLNNVKHLHKGTQMSCWLTIESVPEQPITEPLNPTYAWLIHQTTSILLPLPLVSERARHACTHAPANPLTHTHAHRHNVSKILTGLRMNTQKLPPPSWLIHQTALASWIPEA